jgi:hypothetical protein
VRARRGRTLLWIWLVAIAGHAIQPGLLWMVQEIPWDLIGDLIVALLAARWAKGLS